jgi:hypothetical protein
MAKLLQETGDVVFGEDAGFWRGDPTAMLFEPEIKRTDRNVSKTSPIK